MIEVIQGGYLYIAMPPLFRIEIDKKEQYVYTETQRDVILNDNKGKKITLQRYKGLGEMNPEQLWETTMNPNNRKLKQISIEDGEEADRVFDMLMGNEVKPRRQFIQRYSKEADLDI